MTYSETIQYLFSHLPMYQRVGAPALKKDLTNTLKLCDFSGNPQQKIKTIHVAGTNGKGSVSHILASVLMEAGFKTGLYTSPHLLDFRERIKIDGELVSEDFVVSFTEKIKPVIADIEPSFFEITVAMAFEAFANAQVDFAIIETGLGGRLDSTNVINPECSVITNISLEHQQFLGNTLTGIATEKAGIIKPQTPVIIGRKQGETHPVFTKVAAEKKASLCFSENYFQTSFVETNENISTFLVKNKLSGKSFHVQSELAGSCQAENINTVFSFCQAMKEEISISKENILLGISKVIRNTGLHGRWEIVSQSPTVILDIAHNPDAISKGMAQLKQHHYENLYIVFGCSNDKDLNRIIPLLPKEAEYHFARPDVPRGMEVEFLAQTALKYCIDGKIHSSVKEAIESVRNKMQSGDLLLVTGSAFVVADALRCAGTVL